ncbi:SMI1/KNR4 family protein [Streptomyces luteolus]|uniref:SMI1/KNR4 family protein n=1 Tax=Streptomyces luteolus TaxID=3043615 RepID=A0ABT6T7H4_9ACTN|nr:SMI1/KNR4 family protein [Streptomyces sp. B-S-A12]MDI3423847.1 SMI1/KNR4 family protein [Streptomyces sp. B-S-A12]
MSDVIRAWSRIENWLHQHRCTSNLKALHPPASEEAIRSLQDTLPYPLHPHLVQWLQLHDGAMHACGIWPFRYSPINAEGMKGGPQLFAETFEDFRSEFTDDGLEPEGPEGPWDPPNAYEFWVPIAVTNTGEYLAVDHRSGNTYGTVREIDYEGTDVWGVIRWQNLGEMFDEIADGLESGAGVRGGGRTYRHIPRVIEVPPLSTVPHLYATPVVIDGDPVHRLEWRIEQ